MATQKALFSPAEFHLPMHPNKSLPGEPLPYVRGVSECVRRILVSSQIKVCYKPYQNLRTLLSRPKDQVPDLQRSGVVYKIPCVVCSKVYIGQTGRRLCQRISEHNRAVKSANFNSSTLAEHAWSAGHPVDWDNVSIVRNCPDYNSRIVQEAIVIRPTNDALNRDKGSLPPDNLVT